MVQSLSGVSCSLTLNAVPGDLNLYVYLNHLDGHCSVAMGFLYYDAKSYFNTVECSDCRQHVRCFLPFRIWSVIGLSSSLLLVVGPYGIYILLCIIYI